MVRCAPCAVDASKIPPGVKTLTNSRAVRYGAGLLRVKRMFTGTAATRAMKDREKLVGHPSDYGSRTLENEGLGSNDETPGDATEAQEVAENDGES